MSLFSTIQQSSNALQVSQLGLNVVGNNIANANTPGYLRQELIQSSGPGIRVGGVILGYGVRATGVVQKVDEYTVDRLRQTESKLASSDAVGEVYNKMEAIFGELTDSDLSTQLSDFSASINDVLNQPGNDSLRRLVIERGSSLTSNIRSVSNQLDNISVNLNSEVRSISESINAISKQIAGLNQRIVEVEGGRSSGSDAVGLRDERITALQELSKLVDIRAVEQVSGAVSVFVGGEYLVADGIQRPVEYALRTDGDDSYPEVRLADTQSPLKVSGGRLHGLYQARDGAVGDAKTNLDQFARDLIEQFNRIHSQGQGLAGFNSVTAAHKTDDSQGPLDLAGFPLEIKNGEFEVQVLDTATGLSQTHTIRVKLQGGTDDTSLEDVRTALDAISGLNSSISTEGGLRIESDSTKLQFSFQNDSSGFLAASGINTFFVGDSANSIGVNPIVAGNPSMFAASTTGVGAATDNALKLAQAFDEPIAGLNNRSIKQTFENIIATTSQDISVQQGLSDGLRNFYRTLEGQHLATSGVNLDEEAVKMIFYQRAFQASSRLIQTSSELLDVLVNL
ncbi:flagellar hook-associated protein FlgK [Aureliella helgolandensis]|uniref:Flagellar hook-associated protein 1 n=1 Tax=Aureliella helgolandensis TaxID=2527968 RepID=A0A518GAN5_9BACT|nr:flagellar hook-associated protein FlgK [Aureliella helgolandensis]QDV25676.1 Flagellar hook-associated protein 1 [Aureliella helgolandensis]